VKCREIWPSTEEKLEVKLFIYVLLHLVPYLSSPCASVRNRLLFANVKCYWPQSETRKSLLFANVKCYWPRSETLKSLFANVKLA